MRSASARAGAIGFSHQTCLPASSAAIAIGACQALGGVIETTSTSGFETSDRQSEVEIWKPNSSARLRARLSSTSQSATRLTTGVVPKTALTPVQASAWHL